ncbi:MAG: hypothetical protein AAFX96_10775 [Pseudomonadota bacterium]
MISDEKYIHIHKGGKAIGEFTNEDIEEIQIISDRRKTSLLSEEKIMLNNLLIDFGTGFASLLWFDEGFDDLVEHLKASQWDISTAIEESNGLRLIRITVRKHETF